MPIRPGSRRRVQRVSFAPGVVVAWRRMTRVVSVGGAAVVVVALGACHTTPTHASATSNTGRIASVSRATAHTAPVRAPAVNPQKGVMQPSSAGGCRAAPGAVTLTLTNTLPHAWVPGDGSSDRWPPVRISLGQQLLVIVPPSDSGGIPTAVHQTHPATLQQICRVVMTSQPVVALGHPAHPVYGSRTVFVAQQPGSDYLTADSSPPTLGSVPGAGSDAGWSGSGSVLVIAG